eukprot:CAMPEP_0175484144 /NCGR_PEP_ID=MMETSP0095-20121207/79848_1 /TAXON_ID=311494 /ORGANISM="Alexandrium monilatum, Strain CCMP3105" /LENGTH=271 /DNA_ID=CAMNT_0016785867 /DNA_START=40 /DNA_END=853 /DNA_ORIENTATION=+
MGHSQPGVDAGPPQAPLGRARRRRLNASAAAGASATWPAQPPSPPAPPHTSFVLRNDDEPDLPLRGAHRGPPLAPKPVALVHPAITHGFGDALRDGSFLRVDLNLHRLPVKAHCREARSFATPVVHRVPRLQQLEAHLAHGLRMGERPFHNLLVLLISLQESDDRAEGNSPHAAEDLIVDAQGDVPKRLDASPLKFLETGGEDDVDLGRLAIGQGGRAEDVRPVHVALGKEGATGALRGGKGMSSSSEILIGPAVRALGPPGGKRGGALQL